MRVSDVCRQGDGWVDVDITVSPRSNRPGPDGYDEWRKRLVLRISSPPVEGRANKEVCRYFSDLTGGKAEVSSGQTSHQKTVRIRGDVASLMSRLEGLDGRSGETGAPDRCNRQVEGALRRSLHNGRG